MIGLEARLVATYNFQLMATYSSCSTDSNAGNISTISLSDLFMMPQLERLSTIEMYDAVQLSEVHLLDELATYLILLNCGNLFTTLHNSGIIFLIFVPWKLENLICIYQQQSIRTNPKSPQCFQSKGGINCLLQCRETFRTNITWSDGKLSSRHIRMSEHITQSSEVGRIEWWWIQDNLWVIWVYCMCT